MAKEPIERCETIGCLEPGTATVILEGVPRVRAWLCSACAYLATKAVQPHEPVEMPRPLPLTAPDVTLEIEFEDVP